MAEKQIINDEFADLNCTTPPLVNGSYEAKPQQEATQQTQQTSSVEHVLSIQDIVHGSAQTGQLTEAGSTYLRMVQESIKQRTKMNIQRVELGAPPAAVAFTYKGYAIILLMDEAMQKQDRRVPTVAHANVAVTSLRTVFPSIKSVCTLVVTEHEYTRAGQMAAYLINTFNGITDPSILHLKVKQFANTPIAISTRADDYNSFVDRHDVHGIHAHATLKMTFSLSSRYNGNNNQPIFNQTVSTAPFAVVGGIVRWVVNHRTGKFTPFIRITECMSTVPTPNIFTLLIPKFIEHFITNNNWAQQYFNFVNDKINIANLAVDRTNGRPFEATNAQEVIDFIQQQTTDPLVLIDVPEGRARIPGMEMFVITDQQASLANAFNVFFAKDDRNVSHVIVPNMAIAEVVGTEVTGYGQFDGKEEDSRTNGYLEVMQRYQVPPCTDLQVFEPDPIRGAETTNKYYQDSFRTLYVSTMAVLVGGVVTNLLQTLQYSGLQFLSQNVEIPTIDASSYIHMVPSYAGAARGTTAVTASAPISTLYPHSVFN